MAAKRLYISALWQIDRGGMMNNRRGKGEQQEQLNIVQNIAVKNTGEVQMSLQ